MKMWIKQNNESMLNIDNFDGIEYIQDSDISTYSVQAYKLPNKSGDSKICIPIISNLTLEQAKQYISSLFAEIR